jgi:hypothetical protein
MSSQEQKNEGGGEIAQDSEKAKDWVLSDVHVLQQSESLWHRVHFVSHQSTEVIVCNVVVGIAL